MQTADLGRALRDAQLTLFEHRDTEFLCHCRQLAVDIARRQGTVCINDIRAQLHLPAEMHPSVLGAVFRSKKFTAVGFTEATHKAAHARVVRVYQLTEEL
ncbi:MAG: hypothetical protein EB015_17020 [Methylocystaceae bacterium]|nr:hypothetical protein [Methylocystaceae bacterium]